MKNRNFVFNLLIAIFAVGFVSCGDDVESFEKGILIGNYTGNCTVSLGSKSDVVSSFPAEFKQKDKNSLYLIMGNATTYESIGISTLKIASEFKDYKGYGGFKLESINDSFGQDKIPNFIKENVSPPFDMVSMTLKLNTDPQSPPTYMMASKNLLITYKGSIEIAGKNADEKLSSSITYVLDLKK